MSGRERLACPAFISNRTGRSAVFERLADLAAEHAQLELDLSDPAIHSDQDRARTLSRRYGELTPIVHAYTEWKQVSADEATARELAPEDSSFAAEALQLAARR